MVGNSDHAQKHNQAMHSQSLLAVMIMSKCMVNHCHKKAWLTVVINKAWLTMTPQHGSVRHIFMACMQEYIVLAQEQSFASSVQALLDWTSARFVIFRKGTT